MFTFLNWLLLFSPFSAVIDVTKLEYGVVTEFVVQTTLSFTSKTAQAKVGTMGGEENIFELSSYHLLLVHFFEHYRFLRYSLRRSYLSESCHPQ